MIVTPAPLETTIEPFVHNINRLSSFYRRFQVDIADGVFVPNTTFQIDDFASVYSTLPPGIVYDFHLMVQRPLLHVQKLQFLPNAVLGTVLIHKSVFPEQKSLYALLPDAKFGLVLNPEDTVESITDLLLSTLHSVQIMTIIPGFQGQPFMPNMLYKIEQLRKRGFLGEILIDGSVNEKTIHEITSLAYPPDVLGVGSYITKASDETVQSRITFLHSQLIPGDKSQEK
jgi:pentose-5-phosphate-3-epimerase